GARLGLARGGADLLSALAHLDLLARASAAAQHRAHIGARGQGVEDDREDQSDAGGDEALPPFGLPAEEPSGGAQRRGEWRPGQDLRGQAGGPDDYRGEEPADGDDSDDREEGRAGLDRKSTRLN